jgi:hypothetical protein
MIRRATVMITAIWMLLALAAGAGMFLLKYRVIALEDRLAEINRGIVSNMEAAHVLKAEWSFLNQPARLEELGRRYLELEVIPAGNIVPISDLPFRPAPGDAPEAAPGATTKPADKSAPQRREARQSPQATDQVSPRLATYRTAQ